MTITKQDRLLYASAIDAIKERFEIATEFLCLDGLPSLPTEDIEHVMITGFKEWITGREGECWLNSLGYSKSNITIISGSGNYCPTCSGSLSIKEGRVCERCGRVMCEPCLSLVDPHYEIVWCNDCLESEALTNFIRPNRW
jgi:hypothetical protein